MKNKMYLIFVLLVILAISGCVSVRKVVRERVDQDVSGNRGYIQGQLPAEPSVVKSKTREYIDIRIEVPTGEEVQGWFPPPEEKAETAPADVETLEEPSQVYIPEPAERVGQLEAVESKPILYKVKEGDSLGKIAKKYYGRASKWTLIYEANMDKIKDPKRIKPGTELIIPALEEESRYIK